MNDSLIDTIKPKSDQLNADDLLISPITVTITGVKRGPADQPVHIHIEGQQPYKPCKSMRRVLISAWGDDGSEWIGKHMTLYCDPSVKFGGVALGGIRISHLSHIQNVMNIMLTASRGRKSQFTVKPIKDTPEMTPVSDFKDVLSAIAKSTQDKNEKQIIEDWDALTVNEKRMVWKFIDEDSREFLNLIKNSDDKK